MNECGSRKVISGENEKSGSVHRLIRELAGEGVILEDVSGAMDNGPRTGGWEGRPYSENIGDHFLRPNIVFGKGVRIQLGYVKAIRWSSRRITILALMGQRRERVPMTDSGRLGNGSLHTLESIYYIVVVKLVSG